MGSLSKYQTGAPKQKMWQSMRILRVFTPSDIAQTAEVSVSYAMAFINTLKRAGYVRKGQGQSSEFATCQLLRNSGPNAPRHWVKERKVFDLNSEVIYELD